MIDKKLSRRVLTVGCAWRPPRGGIAQVLSNYERYVFARFRCVANSRRGAAVVKLAVLVAALCRVALVLLADRRVRIVHIHTASNNSFRRSMLFVRLAHRMGRRTVLHVHGGGFKAFHATDARSISRALNRCDCIVALSDTWRAFFECITSGPRIEVVPNIIPRPQRREADGAGDGRVHLLFLGLITQQKGIFDLLHALAGLPSESAGHLCLHVGGNGEIQRLTDMVTALGLEGTVVVEGWVSGQRKEALLSRCDAFVLPSYAEGLPLSVLEALSYGLPVVATRVGAIPEVVADGANGWLFEPGDRKELGKLLLRMTTTPDVLRRMGRVAATGVEEYYPEAVAQRLESVYRALL